MTNQGDRIREERERAGMTQPQLAKLVGVSARTIGNWERGEVDAPRNSLTRLRDVLPGLREGGPAVTGETPPGITDEELLAVLRRQRAELDEVERRLVARDTGPRKVGNAPRDKETRR